MTPEQRIQALEDRVAILEEALGLAYQPSPLCRFTPTERRLVGVLLKTTRASSIRIETALYAHANNPPTTNNVKVHIHRIRKKLAPLSVQICTDWGFGYWIPAEQKARLLDA